MYGWIFRHLPGPTWFKVIEAMALVALVVWALFTFVYPEFNIWLDGDGTVGVQS